MKIILISVFAAATIFQGVLVYFGIAAILKADTLLAHGMSVVASLAVLSLEVGVVSLFKSKTFPLMVVGLLALMCLPFTMLTTLLGNVAYFVAKKDMATVIADRFLPTMLQADKFQMGMVLVLTGIVGMSPVVLSILLSFGRGRGRGTDDERHIPNYSAGTVPQNVRQLPQGNVVEVSEVRKGRY